MNLSKTILYIKSVSKYSVVITLALVETMQLARTKREMCCCFFIDWLSFNFERHDTNEGFVFSLNVDDNLDTVTRVCKSDLSCF